MVQSYTLEISAITIAATEWDPFVNAVSHSRAIASPTSDGKYADEAARELVARTERILSPVRLNAR